MGSGRGRSLERTLSITEVPSVEEWELRPDSVLRVAAPAFAWAVVGTSDEVASRPFPIHELACTAPPGTTAEFTPRTLLAVHELTAITAEA